MTGLLLLLALQADGFNPKDLDNLEFFVESVKGLALATNTSKEAYAATGENTPLESVWSDAKRFPHGTVRWWQDQSPYKRSEKLRPRANRVFTTGRDIGQDDHDRPGYIPDGCNGKPSVRGGLIGAPAGEKHNTQPCYFEFQVGFRDLKVEGPFGVFLLARPVKQEKTFCYFGLYHRSVLIHDVKTDALRWKNGGKIQSLTGPGAVRIGEWQLVELHRGAENRLTCLVNGRDVTAEPPVDEAAFEFMMLFNNNKGQSEKLHPYAGDIAAMIIYRDAVTKAERGKVRAYLDGMYRFLPAANR